MKDYVVVKAQRMDRGGISHVVLREGGGTYTQRYAAIRAGLSWPLGDMKAYHCVVGEIRAAHEQRGRLELLSEREYESVSIEAIFDHLTDDLTVMLCSNVYTLTEDIGEKDFIEAYQAYMIEKKVNARLDQAPFADNFALGIYLVNDWLRMGRLVLPEKSIVREQLKRISKYELAPQEHPEQKYHAINGLRYVLAAFQKFVPPSKRRVSSKRRRGAQVV
jgi:hypothetical protein